MTAQRRFGAILLTELICLAASMTATHAQTADPCADAYDKLTCATQWAQRQAEQTVPAPNDTPPIANDTVVAAPLTKATVIAVYAAVRERLRDPDSAQFRNLFAFRDLSNPNVLGIQVCGEVNAKNGFGGYSGYTAFSASVGDAGNMVALLGDDDLIGSHIVASCRIVATHLQAATADK